MKLPQLLYNKTDIFILLCLRLSLYCPLQGAAVVGGDKTWPQRLGTHRQYQHYPGRLWDCGHDLGCFDVQSSVEHETKYPFFTELSRIANETMHVKCVWNMQSILKPVLL